MKKGAQSRCARNAAVFVEKEASLAQQDGKQNHVTLDVILVRVEPSGVRSVVLLAPGCKDA